MTDAPSRAGSVEFVDIDWRGRPLSLETQWVGADAPGAPVVVFLHEGLGSLSMWKDFPARLCSEHGFCGLVFSRYGYGQSTPKPPGERWPVDYMQAQAHEVLPALFARLGIERPWLFGHSDGASIALLYASRFADRTAGVIAVAPHIFVEDLSIQSIEKARDAFESTDLRARLARHHADPDATFRAWNDIWLDPAFRAWSIEHELDAITCPVLAVQGQDDEYGTLEQAYGIARRLPKTRLLILPKCAHSVHRDQPERLAAEAARFIREAS